MGVWDSTTLETGDLDAEWDIEKIKLDLAKKYAARREAGPGGVNGVAESDKSSGPNRPYNPGVGG